MSNIVTLTMNPSIDKSADVAHVMPERKLRCGTPRFDPGGGGINVSRAILRLGGNSLAIYTSGGFAGQHLEELLNQEGLVHRPIPVSGLTRENLHVYETSTGQQYRLNMPGMPVPEAEWRAALSELDALNPPADYLVLSGSLPQGVPDCFFAEAVKIGRQQGARVIVDTSGEPLRLATEAMPYLIKPNAGELSLLAGSPIEEDDHVEEAAKKVISTGKCQAIAVSMAAAGVYLFTANGSFRIPAPVVKAVSRVGAGDSMVGGTVLALSRGLPLRDAVQYGVAAGTAAVMREGTQLCHLDDTERLYAKMKV